MKKRNLFLSLMCSVVLTITLVVFAVVSIVSPNGKKPDDKPVIDNPVSDIEVPADINDKADGTKENPYFVYSPESFNELIAKYGYTKIGEKILDEEGNPVLDEEGNEKVVEDSAYFELYCDIDFAGTNYVTLFNGETPFNGHIDGKGHSIKNVSMNVSIENIASYLHKAEYQEGVTGAVYYRYILNLGMFGTIEDAEITNLTFDAFKVAVDNNVYNYILEAKIVTDDRLEGIALNNLVVATLASYANNSVIEVNMNAEVDANAYSRYSENLIQGYNTVGGLVGVADGSTIKNSTINVVMNVDKGLDYSYDAKGNKYADNNYVGGVAGYAVNGTKIENTTVDMTVSATTAQELYVGGVAGYTNDVTIDKTSVKLVATESRSERFNANGVKSIDEDRFTWVAGIVAIVNSDTNISNTTVLADVDFDCIFAGVFIEATSIEAQNIVVKDIIVNANVNVLKAFGIARDLGNANVTLSATVEDIEHNDTAYNLKLTGNVLIKGTNDPDNRVVAFVDAFNGRLQFGSSLKVIISTGLKTELNALEQVSKVIVLEI